MTTSRRDVIAEIKARADIVDVVTSYLPLRRAGKGWSACCPFHEEKTPSFHVSPERQIFHCFGCGEKGSVFDFVMKSDRLDFREALRVLADRYGVALEETRGGADQGSGRADLLKVHAWAQDRFRDAFRKREGEACRRYVEGRGILPAMVDRFGLGFAPDEWTYLCDLGRTAGFSTALLERAGLALPGVNRPGHYDRFRGRLTFPIRDSLERTIAFGARTLDGSEPKYLNSPETDLFHKGRTLFGIDLLRKHPREVPIMVMEGYTDVLMTCQVGVTGAVATLGTALTPDHARLLSRYSDRILLVYDGDRAGLAAAERGAGILLEAGHLDLQVVVLPDGEDPCDFFSKRGPEGSGLLQELKTDLLDFLLARAALKHDLDTMGGRRSAAGMLLKAAAAIGDPVSKEVVLGRLSERLEIPKSALREQLVRQVAPIRPPPSSGVAPAAAPPKIGLTGRIQLELVQAILNDPQCHLGDAELDLVPDSRVRSLLQHLDSTKRAGKAAVGDLLDSVPAAAARDLAKKALLPPDHGLDLVAQLEGGLKRLKMLHSEQTLRNLKDRVGDQESWREVLEVARPLKTGDKPSAGRASEARPRGDLP